MIRLCATLLLALALSLMPLAMTGGAAMGAAPAPAAESAAAASACPDHHQSQQQQPDAPVTPQDKGALHCQMCVALPQPDQVEMPGQLQASASHAVISLPQLAGIADDVSVPPPRNA